MCDAMHYVGGASTSIGLLEDMWSFIYECLNNYKILDENGSNLREKIERLKSCEDDIITELENARYQCWKKEKKEVEFDLSSKYQEAKQSSSLLISPAIGLSAYEAPALPDKIEIQQNNVILILLDKVVSQNFELKRELSALRSEFDKEVINLKNQIRDLDSKVSKPSTSKSDMDKVLDKLDHIQQPQGLFDYEKILDHIRKIQPEQFKMVPAKEEPTINTAVPFLEEIS